MKELTVSTREEAGWGPLYLETEKMPQKTHQDTPATWSRFKPQTTVSAK